MEAYYTLGIMRAAILRISFKRLTRSLEHQAKKSELVQLDEEQIQMALSIGKAIGQAASPYSLGECLPCPIPDSTADVEKAWHPRGFLSGGSEG